MSKLRIVITGASGFVGKDLLRFLDEELYEITVISRDKKKLENKFSKSVQVVEADLLNVTSLKSAFENKDVLINLAAEVRNHDMLEKTNVQGTKNCIEALQNSAIKKVIHLSSVGVVGKPYSDNLRIIDENCDTTPQNEYERTKLISEELFVKSAESNLFDLLVLRPTNVFGEKHPFNALLNLMQTLQKESILVFTNEAKVNYVYVSDLSQVIVSSLEKKIENGIYNVGNAMDLKDFYSIIAEALELKARIIKVPSFLVKFVSKLGISKLQSISNQTVYSDEKLKKFISYSFGVEKGINNTVKYYKQQGLLK